MRIVISYLTLVGFGGTESYLLTVAGELERLGHDVVIHAPETGQCAESARDHGARIIERESQLPPSCELVLAQDAATAYSMAARYPDAARVFVAHSTGHPHQTPPQLDGTSHAVVVMNDRLQRRVEQLASRPRVVRLSQPINLQRFCFSALNLEQRHPPRVLVLSNYTQGARERMIAGACKAAGLTLTRAGATSTPTATPEHEIRQAEIVISIGRGALEAMASGRAAYVFGDAGGDGWVTAESYPALESDGFSGRALGESIGIVRLAEDLAQWREELGEVGRDLACAHHDVGDHATALLALVDEFASSPPATITASEELARLVRLEFDQNSRARSAIAQAGLERDQAAALRAEVTELYAALDRERTELAHVREQLDQLRNTRRFRLASGIAAPLDRLRGALARRR